MPNTSSAKKITRKIARRTEVNKAGRSEMRTHIRNVEEAITKGDAKTAEQALKSAESELMSAATKGLLHKNTASRKVSRLTKAVRKLKA